MKFKRSKLDFAVWFMITVIVLLIAALFVADLYNEGNRITSGVIVDKEYNTAYGYSSGHSSGRTYRYDQSYWPAEYRFCIEGEKDGKLVRYWFDVPEEEYVQYQVGDFYTR